MDGCTIEIGSGALVSVGEVAEKIVQMINPEIKPLFGHFPERPMEQVRVASTEETYSMTGWKATTSLENGLLNTIRWYKDLSDIV